jgi:hypothetical protein
LHIVSHITIRAVTNGGVGLLSKLPKLSRLRSTVYHHFKQLEGSTCTRLRCLSIDANAMRTAQSCPSPTAALAFGICGAGINHVTPGLLQELIQRARYQYSKHVLSHARKLEVLRRALRTQGKYCIRPLNFAILLGSLAQKILQRARRIVGRAQSTQSHMYAIPFTTFRNEDSQQYTLLASCWSYWK